MTTFHNTKPCLFITGGNGQLASAIKNHAFSQNFNLVFYSHTELDINHCLTMQLLFVKHRPDFVINTAAYTQVDQAEINQAACLEANYKGVKQLANVCKKNNIPLLHISTDYVFDGQQQLPYTEKDMTNPLQFYGHSKYMGEEAIRQTCDYYIILRVSGIFSEFGNNFVKTILRLIKEKPTLTIVADQFTCPTYAGDIATAIFKLVNHLSSTADTLHFCTGPSISWFEFTKEILRHIPNNINLQTINTCDYPTLAKRPLYSVLNCEKIKNIYHIAPPEWLIGLKQTILQLSKEK